MTAPRDTERLIRNFLADGPTVLPDRSYDAIRDDVDLTDQRVVIGPWRIPEMLTFAKLAAGAAAVIVASVLGVNLLSSPPQVVGPPGPVASPSASPTASPSPSPSPSPTAQPGDLPTGYTVLGPGTYVFHDTDGQREIRVAFDGQPGWLGRGWYITSPEGYSGQAALGAWGWGQTWGPIRQVFVDPCERDPATADVGSGVDDMISALLAQHLRDNGDPTDIMVSGYAGKALVSTIQPTSTGSCRGGHLEVWARADGTGRWVSTGMSEVIWVLDVEGTTLVLESSWDQSTPTSYVDQLDAIMRSIAISVRTLDQTIVGDWRATHGDPAGVVATYRDDGTFEWSNGGLSGTYVADGSTLTMTYPDSSSYCPGGRFTWDYRVDGNTLTARVTAVDCPGTESGNVPPTTTWVFERQ